MRFDLVDLRLFLHVTEARSVTRTRLIVQQVERMRGDLGSFARGLAGSVRLLSNTAALSEYLPRVLAGFLTANPTISLDVEERESADIAAALGSAAADVGIASVAVLPDTIEQFPFRDDVLVLVFPQGEKTARRRALALADVVDRAFVGLPRDSALQRHIVGHATRLGATMNIRARVTSLEAVCRMVEAGAGIGIVPEVLAKRCRRSMNIDVVRLNDAWAKRRLAICVRRLACATASSCAPSAGGYPLTVSPRSAALRP